MPRRAYKRKGALARPLISYNRLYLACLRIVTKPVTARRATSRTIAHSERVGTAVAARSRAVKDALAGVTLVIFGPALVIAKAPTPSVLVKLPAADMVTFTATVQVPGAPPGIVVAVGKDTVEFPATAVGTPPQLVTAFGVGATTMPAGKVSVKGDARVVVARLSLLNVMVSLETPPALMVVGKKVLLSATPFAGGTGVTNGVQVGTVIVF